MLLSTVCGEIGLEELYLNVYIINLSMCNCGFNFAYGHITLSL